MHATAPSPSVYPPPPICLHMHRKDGVVPPQVRSRFADIHERKHGLAHVGTVSTIDVGI
ncbi:hypothetical protein NEUTE1DRAFT_98081 [Neurospora tetrasperma FGSC 2508]|uniref:Uncharacterized protein n=1 Tax=Neurospora tetrasperma (strain FGSC 2508 / ATCC MYA-4615 / P0657) TaxID=510951 RepID=F8MF69_NEUT8|nr:uncharacterized protein NEUTE1DRAFT_98081 [Neurospora tetrasperma FGSC 2508]EGO60923.1 hypothetical protein NEUTE1DRAFT_98081 [Neurospora tetrasperma FGSC 2508]EGZ75079.1 hypothetical protein NEUTE2DRAFT_126021 [Neurospora tetrasperma FGSC 2509]